jgi:hypothetical protein
VAHCTGLVVCGNLPAVNQHQFVKVGDELTDVVPDLRKLLCEMVGHFAELLIFSPKKVSRYGHTAENSSS